MKSRNNSNKAILENPYIVPQFEEVITFDDRFIRDKLSTYLIAGYKDLAVQAPYKSGKTHGIAWQLAMAEAGPVSIVIIAYSGLCISTASALKNKSIEFGMPKNIIDYQQLDGSNAQNADVIVTTFNSLPKVMDFIGSRKINFAIFDEVEHGAKFLTSNAIDNKSEFQLACSDLSKRADKMILLDANLRKASELLINYYLPDRNFAKLVNTGQPWKDHTFAQYEGEEQGIALLNDLLGQGKKLFVSSSSRSQAARIYTHAIDNLGISTDKIICAFASNKDVETYPERLEEAKKNPAKFANYDLVIGSPALATGISIEVENHFDSTVLFAVHDPETPDPIQVMQQPFRVRNSISKHIDVIYCDNSDRGEPINTKQASDQYSERLAGKKIIESYGALNQAQIDAWMLAGSYAVEIAEYNHAMFKDYLNIIKNSFKDLGISEVDAVQYATDEAKSQLINVRGELKEAQKTNILIAENITDSQAETLKKKKETRGLQLSEDSQLERYKIISEYHFGSDLPDDDQLKAYIEYAAQGVAVGAYNLANTMMLGSEFKQYVKAKNSDNSGLKRLDATSNRDTDLLASYRLDCALADMIDFNRIDGKFCFNYEREYSITGYVKKIDKKSRRSKMSAIKEALAKFVKVNPESAGLVSKIDKKPAHALMELLKTRFKFDNMRKVRGKDSFTIGADQPVIDHLESRHKAGLMSGVFHGLAIVSAGRTAKAIANKVKIDSDTSGFIIERLSTVPSCEHAALATEYIRIVLDIYADKHNWSGVRDANIRLGENTEK